MDIKMKKQLFKKASIEEIKHNATVGGYNQTRYLYINGYYESAKELVEIAICSKYNNKKDTLFYPICYNYRHYLELHIKSLIVDTEILYDKMEQLAYLENGNLSEKISDNLDNTHNLYDLFELFIERLNLVSNEKFPNDIKKYIKQMHDTDKDGQKYRYYHGTNKKLSFPKEEQFDLKNISNIMEEVHDLLWGVDGYLDHYIQMSNDIIHDYEAEMRLAMEQEMRSYYY
jgi:hypothetical protein